MGKNPANLITLFWRCLGHRTGVPWKAMQKGQSNATRIMIMGGFCMVFGRNITVDGPAFVARLNVLLHAA